MDRYVEVYGRRRPSSSAPATWKSGSGYALGANLIITAAHVVRDQHEHCTKIQVRVENQLIAATILWVDRDAALLELKDLDLSGRIPWRPIRWGRLITDRSGIRVEAIGFPAVVAEPDMRDSYHARGTINGGSLIKSKYYALEVDNFPDPPLVSTQDPDRSKSWWHGMSGSGVFVRQEYGGPVLIGVVMRDPRGFSSRRLTAIPVERLLKNKQFVEVVASVLGTYPHVEAVELISIAVSAPALSSPTMLLRADANTTPFRERSELQTLLSWCSSDDQSSTRLVYGSGGQGKTRLAHELARRLSEIGWATLILADVAEADRLYAVKDSRTPTLVIVDYAEARLAQLEDIYRISDAADIKIRVLLLARTAGAWRTELSSAPASNLGRLLDERIAIALGPLESDLAGRQSAWSEALSAYAVQLLKLPGYETLNWTSALREIEVPDLTSPEYRTILAIQISALTSLLQAGTPLESSSGDPKDLLLQHEANYWIRVAAQYPFSLSRTTQRILVSGASLWTARTSSEAGNLMLGFRPEDGLDTRRDIGSWLATLYSDDEHFWGPLQPDVLAEHLIATTLSNHGDGLLALNPQTVSDSQLEAALTTLGRASHAYSNHYLYGAIRRITTEFGLEGARAAIAVAPRLLHPNPILNSLQDFCQAASYDELQSLHSAISTKSVILRDLSLTVSRRLAAESSQYLSTDDLAHHLVHAAALNSITLQLSATEQNAEACSSGLSAVVVSERLVEIDESYLYVLATTLSNASYALSHSLEHQELGLEYAQRGIAIRRSLATSDHEALQKLAGDLTSFSNQLNHLGKVEEAVSVGREAITVAREGQLPNQNEYEATLGATLNNCALHLLDVGQGAEGIRYANEAVEIYRSLVEKNRDLHLVALASSIGALQRLTVDSGDIDQGVRLAEEAIELIRELLQYDRPPYLRLFVMALGEYIDALRQVNRWDTALSASIEATSVASELATLDVSDAMPFLALGHYNSGRILYQMGRMDEANARLSESVELFQELSNLQPGNLQFVADASLELADVQIELNDERCALRWAQAAVLAARDLVSARGPEHRATLAVSLTKLALVLEANSDLIASLDAAEESATLLRRIDCDKPSARTIELMAALEVLARVLGLLGRIDDARSTFVELIGLWRSSSDERLQVAAERINTIAGRLAITLSGLRIDRVNKIGLLREALVCHSAAVEVGPSHEFTELFDCLEQLVALSAKDGHDFDIVSAVESVFRLWDQPGRKLSVPDLSRFGLLLHSAARNLLDSNLTEESVIVGDLAVIIYRRLLACDLQYRDGLRATLHNLAIAARNRCQFDRSLSLACESVSVCRELYHENAPEAKVHLVLALELQSLVMVDTQDLVGAVECLDKAATIAVSMDKNDDSNAGVLGRIYLNAGRLYSRLRDFSEAARCVEGSLENYRGVAESDPARFAAIYLNAGKELIVVYRRLRKFGDAFRLARMLAEYATLPTVREHVDILGRSRN